ncbi:MAG: DUF2922 domain-containing protein [Senegalia sp. (in: firmicutes)]|uniref:DUF2922 domain-containing protein n=1 Tax=Senegalia sp. (in: firmicutes) TaxID=1924098 RepID=UPI003F9B0184
MSKKLELVFKNQMDRTSRISVDEPREDLTEFEITEAMNALIEKNIFKTSGGDLKTISGARIITTQIEELTV